MRRSTVRALAALAVTGAVLGVAPAAMAWGSVAYTNASCWRWVLTDNGRFGGDGGNYTPIPGVGGDRVNFYIRVDAYLKHGAYTNNVDFVRGEGSGTTDPRKDHNGVVGDRTWYVYAYGQDAPGHTATQIINSCTIT